MASFDYDVVIIGSTMNELGSTQRSATATLPASPVNWAHQGADQGTHGRDVEASGQSFVRHYARS